MLLLVVYCPLLMWKSYINLLMLSTHTHTHTFFLIFCLWVGRTKWFLPACATKCASPSMQITSEQVGHLNKANIWKMGGKLITIYKWLIPGLYKGKQSKLFRPTYVRFHIYSAHHTHMQISGRHTCLVGRRNLPLHILHTQEEDCLIYTGENGF